MISAILVLAVLGEISYGPDKLDVYSPKEKGPIVVLLHGGGWVSSDKERYIETGEYFARNGICCFVPNYRLSENYRDQAADVAAAVAWCYRNGGKYRGDVNRISVVGYSAGGHLGALVTLDPQYLKKEGLNASEVIKRFVGISGVYRINSTIVTFRPSVFDDDLRAASPIEFIQKTPTQFLLLNGSRDLRLLDGQSEEFNDKLQKNGCRSRLIECDRSNHRSIMNKFVDSDYAKEILKFIKSQ